MEEASWPTKKSHYFKVNAKMNSEVKSAIAERNFRAEKSI